MNYWLEHSCRRLRDGRWTPGYTLRVAEGPVLNVSRFLDNKLFLTEEAAKERNRELARNWLALKDPDGGVFEKRN